MRLLIYIEPTPYLMGLWRELKAGSNCPPQQLVFVHQDLSQPWKIDLSDDPQITALRGSLQAKLLQLLKLTCRSNVDLVHLAGWAGPLMLLALLVARIRGIPITVESDTSAQPSTPRWKRIVKRLVYPLLFKLPSMFLPGGSRQAVYLRGYGVPQKRIQVAQMTVDVSAISAYVDTLDAAARERIRGTLGIPEGATVFLFVGRLEPIKGIQELLGAFELMKGHGHQVALLVVGDGSLQSTVAESARKDPRIIPLGRRSGKMLLATYAAADVFVLPARAEPWGLVVNEAMASGLPVVVTDVVGCIDDLVKDGVTGLVVPAGSEAELAQTMSRVVQNPALRSQMAGNARSLISRWTLAAEAEIMTATWHQLGNH